MKPVPVRAAVMPGAISRFCETATLLCVDMGSSSHHSTGVETSEGSRSRGSVQSWLNGAAKASLIRERSYELARVRTLSSAKCVQLVPSQC